MIMEISAALIVKNEEDCLPRCLQSLDGAVDEIVVVDTGSTDRTKSIAAQFTDRLYDFTWTDDFAAARNFAVQNATGDYVLSIDADEAIINTSDAARLLRTFIQQHPSHTLGTVAVRSVINLGEGMENVDAIQRFFNRHQFRYEGRIHEQLAPSGGGATVAPT